MSERVLVAMSGGVDSSAVAGLLHRRGERIVGMTMQLWNQRRLPHLAAESVCGFAAGGRAFRPQARSGVTGALAVGRRLVAGCLERPLGSGLAGPLVVSLLKAAASRLNPPDSSGLP